MEGILQKPETIVEIDWRTEKTSAVDQVDAWVSEIQGFESMALPEQIAALEHLLNEKVKIKNSVVDNKLRFVAEILSLRIELFKEELQHQEAKRALEAALG